MSTDTAAPAGIGHNLSPVTLPKEQEMLADLQHRFPDIESQISEFETALETYPEELELKDEDIAANLGDLLGKIKKTKKVWSDAGKAERGPLKKLVAIVTNFFEKADERLDGFTTKWAPIHQAFLDKKRAEAVRKAEEEAERQRAAADEARKKREEEEKKAEAARLEAEEQRRKEQEAREAAERATRERAEAEERARKAREEEKRLADEKRKRDAAERDLNTESIKLIRTYMKSAEKLNELGEAEESSADEITALDVLIRAGGKIGQVAAQVLGSALLTDEQRDEMEKIRTRLGELRAAVSARLDKKERARRAKEAKEHEERERQESERRRIAREAEEARLAAAKANREEEERKAAVAAEDRRKATEEARSARESARSSEAQARSSSKQAARAGTDEERSENRAGRIENKLERSTDADLSRTRGDLGTVQSLSRRWAYYIDDDAALRKVLGPLGPYLTIAALQGAVFHWMRARQGEWTNRESFASPELPGVRFAYEQESRIA